ncbi:MAG TPA: hypothetical protein VIH25_05880 [Steroidobacteraceae bacterium]
MSTTTRLVATILIAASFGAVLAAGGAGLLERGTPAGGGAPESTLQEVRATIRTDWLAPVSARRSLEQRNQALERWVADRGGHARVLDSDSVLRTRDDAGARLRVPVAQLERTLVIFVPRQQAVDLEQALAGLDATVADIAADAGVRRPTVEF